MLEIKSEQTILQAELPEEHRKLLLKLWQALANLPGYEPDSDGYIVYLINEQSLAAMGFEGNSFDGCCYYPEANCYELISICNNWFQMSRTIKSRMKRSILKNWLGCRSS